MSLWSSVISPFLPFFLVNQVFYSGFVPPFWGYYKFARPGDCSTRPDSHFPYRRGLLSLWAPAPPVTLSVHFQLHQPFCCVAILNSGFIFIISLLTPPCVSLLSGPCLHVLRAGGFAGLSVTAAPHRTLWSPGAPVICVLCSLPGPHVPVILLFSDLPFFFFPASTWIFCIVLFSSSHISSALFNCLSRTWCFVLVLIVWCHSHVLNTVGAVWGVATGPWWDDLGSLIWHLSSCFLAFGSVPRISGNF